MRWDLHAACKDKPVEWFYPQVEGMGASLAIWKPGKAICAVCPVREACLAEAIENESRGNHHRHGLWGGLTPQERSRYAAGRVVVGPFAPTGGPADSVRASGAVRGSLRGQRNRVPSRAREGTSDE